jgi:hypothetical protein
VILPGKPIGTYQVGRSRLAAGRDQERSRRRRAPADEGSQQSRCLRASGRISSGKSTTRTPARDLGVILVRHSLPVSQVSDPGPAAWTGSDAWVFAAIANDLPPATHTLTELIAIADGINHAVLAEAEFTRAIGRLLAAGLIGADPEADRYWPTEAGANIRERWRHGAFGWIDAIPPQLQRLGEPRDTNWSLPEGMFDRAVLNHLERMQRLMKKYERRLPTTWTPTLPELSGVRRPRPRGDSSHREASPVPVACQNGAEIGDIEL